VGQSNLFPSLKVSGAVPVEQQQTSYNQQKYLPYHSLLKKSNISLTSEHKQQKKLNCWGDWRVGWVDF
jgi:hypothetical protein